MVCPRCRGNRCVVIEESTTEQKGFGICKGLCGYILMGPVGILCGLCGMGEGRTHRRAYWVCQDCGNKFRC